jgi:hypothetical protein
MPIFFVPSCITTISFVASLPGRSKAKGTLHLSALYSASPPILLSKGEEAVLHIFNQLHIYHINFSPLLITFVVANNYQHLRKARAVP